jgi:hypothetical protein
VIDDPVKDVSTEELLEILDARMRQNPATSIAGLSVEHALWRLRAVLSLSAWAASVLGASPGVEFSGSAQEIK